MDLLLLVTFSMSFGSSAHKLRIWFFPSCLLQEAACKLGLFWELLVLGHLRANSRRPVLVLRKKTHLGEGWPIVQSLRTCKSCVQFPSLLQFPSISSGESLLPQCYSSLPVTWGEHQVLSQSLIGKWNSLKRWRLVQQMCWFWGCLLWWGCWGCSITRALEFAAWCKEKQRGQKSAWVRWSCRRRHGFGKPRNLG